MSNWQELGGDFGEFASLEEKKPIEGEYIRKTEHTGDFDTTVYTFKDKDEKVFSINGSAVLDRKMAEANIGDFLQIEFLGMQKNQKGNASYKDFKVSRDLEKVSSEEERSAKSESAKDDKDLPF